MGYTDKSILVFSWFRHVRDFQNCKTAILTLFGLQEKHAIVINIFCLY